MRIVAWNCHRRFAAKYPILRDLSFDVAVVSECGPFETGLDQERALTYVMHRPAGIANGDKHLGVFAQEPWALAPLDLGTDYPWCSAAAVTGPRPFTLLGIWTQGPALMPRKPTYATQTRLLVDEVLPDLVGDVVLAGDFNAPASDKAEIERHAATVDALADHGLVSAFLATKGAEQVIAEPTYFHQWKEAMPFHIDHVFLPKTWSADLAVSVGSYAEWVATGRSDHVPMVVDIAD
ncbi:MAG: endonuclease/exonuclease/phosphatase family protein [Aeromicrobium sp.]